MKQKIDEFLNRYAPEEILQRGVKLYNEGAVTYISYDIKSKTYYFKVQGSRPYIVRIKLPEKEKIATSCNCPFTWGPVCKHTVAALQYLKNDFDFKDNKAKHKKSSTKDEKILVINNFDKFRKQDLTKLNVSPKGKFGFNSKYTLNDVSINNKNVLTFKMFYEDYYTDESLEVFCKYKSGNLSIWTTQNVRRFNNSIKPAEWHIVNFMLSHKKQFLDFLDPEKYKIIKENATANYGLKPKDFKKYFDVKLDNDDGIKIIIKPEEAGLISVVGENELNLFIKQLDVFSKPESFLAGTKIKKDRILGFNLEFDDDDDEYYDEYYEEYLDDENEDRTIIYNAFAAKPNKAQTKLISRFSEYDPESDTDVMLLPGQRMLAERINEFFELNIDAPDDKQRFFSLSQSIFKALTKQKFVFFRKKDDGYLMRKSDFRPVTLSENFVNVALIVKQNKQFVTVQAFLKINNELVDFSKIDKPYSDDKIIYYNKVFYHLNSFKDAYLIKNFSKQLKVVKSHKDVLYQKVIEPLAKNYEIQFADKTFDYESVALDFKKKQVFLSEEEDYIIIKLQVVYDNDMEVLLTTEGDYVQKDPETDKIIKYVRNKELEADFVEEISDLHPDFEEQKHQKLFYLHFEDFIKDMWFYQFFDYLHKHQIELYGVKDLKNFKYSPHKGKITTSVSSGQDWFDVKVDIRFGDNIVSLKDIKRAIVNKQKYIRLGDGSVGILPDEWLHKLEKYFRNASQVEKDNLKISKLRFSIIDEMFDRQDQLDILEEIAEKKQRLKAFKEIKNVKVPRSIKAKLRPYQKEGLNWLNFLDEMGWGGILADDMGLGKTLQILTFLQHIIAKDKTPNLIVVPTTLLFNWQKEIEKFAPKLKAYYHYGTDRRQDTKEFKKYHLIITTYGTLLRDIEWLHEYQFNYAILDESQAIKNPSSRRFKAASLLKTNNRLALTGTPIENSTFDLYAQMSFVNPGFFINIKSFKENYSNPIDKDANEMVATELQKLINPFVLRRTKEQVATELPPKVEDVIYCEMPPAQRKVYDAYRNKYRDKLLNQIEEEGIAKTKFMVLEALTRLRQICDSPLLLNDDSVGVKDSVKIQEIITHITDKTAQHKILIFSQFTSMLALIKEQLDLLGISYEYLDGKSTTKQREASVQRFQTDDDLRVFLISLKAGGTGLNLTAADYVYIMDPWWNPAVENQAIDRIYRIGQDKKVFAYRMICKDTVEEKILDLQAKKKKIATDIVQTDEKIMKSLNVDDIKNLLG